MYRPREVESYHTLQRFQAKPKKAVRPGTDIPGAGAENFGNLAVKLRFTTETQRQGIYFSNLYWESRKVGPSRPAQNVSSGQPATLKTKLEQELEL